MNMEMGRKVQKKPGKFLFSSGTEFQEIPASECHCDTCGQTDRYNETNIGLRNFIRNVHNEKWIKKRERRNVEWDSRQTLMYSSTTDLQ